jgi:hypothetical protein
MAKTTSHALPRTIQDALTAAVEDRARELAGLVGSCGWPCEDAVRNLKATTCFGPATIERTVARARELLAH